MDIIKMTTSDWINLSLSAISLIIAIASIWAAVATLKQNRRMLEASSRPYIAIYTDCICVREQSTCFVLKNFGNSPARIVTFKFPEILSTAPQDHTLYNEQFFKVNGLILAQGQSKLLYFDFSAFGENQELSFTIEYVAVSDTEKKHPYRETFTFIPRKLSAIPIPRPETHNEPTELIRINNSLREIIERII